jgi:site-specific DNA-cytosine methylase
MKYLSLFSGIGGFELGIQQAYEDNLKCQHISEESEQEECEQRGKWSTDEPD